MKRVFVIEDDSLMRELIVRRLTRRHCTVEAFSDAADALDPIVVERPDLVLSDFRMPRMSGIELVRRLRAQAIGVPVIIVTAEPGPELLEQALALGVAHVFKKPLGESSPVWQAVDDELGAHDGSGPDPLDGLRFELLTELSHQLRTPLTATKLAIDGLFSQLDGMLDGPQRQLADISRRNIDRLVALVENQLDTLRHRISSGDVESEDTVGTGTSRLVPARGPTRD